MWRTDLTRASPTWLPLLLRALPEARSLRPPRPESEYVTESGDIIAGSFCRPESAAAGSVLRHGEVTRQPLSWSPDQVARRLGLERWHPHQLRHTFGTAVEEELGDPRLTAELLGHSGLGSVSGYTKISRRRREEAAAALADRGF